jgi:uncharacterized protein
VSKLIFWVVVVLVVLTAARISARMAAARELQRDRRDKARAAQNAAETARRQAQRRAADQSMRVAEQMVRCAHCGIHLPRSEALLSNGQTWCCAEHARLGARIQA